MTTTTLAFATGFSVMPWLDRGLSDEAGDLRNIAKQILDYGNSISLGEIRRASQVALDQAFSEALVDNWDGMGSRAAEATTYYYASKFLDLLPSSMPIPEISVDRDGEICFEWDSGPRQVFTTCVGRDGTLTFAGLFGYRKSHGVEILGESLPQIISENIEKATALSDS